MEEEEDKTEDGTIKSRGKKGENRTENKGQEEEEHRKSIRRGEEHFRNKSKRNNCSCDIITPERSIIFLKFLRRKKYKTLT
jgi:hypothetical protein